ncbi:MAG: V-type ATP synthase subunit A, partial [Spirochaetales bacterium]|nr:V-type ATP synthase subunit A [Spirochaetales bacterium]
QQDSFNNVDMAVSLERQNHDLALLNTVLEGEFVFDNKAEARSWFYQIRQKFLDHNVSEWHSEGFESIESELKSMIGERLGSQTA